MAVAMAGAAEALTRYGIGLLAGPQRFPWSTLAINVVGSFLLGVVLVAGPSRSEAATVVLAAGFLGAFTTFSTFSVEAFTLARTGRGGAALAYVAASLALGVAAAALGWMAGRTIGG